MAMLNRIYGLGVGFAFMAAGGALALGRARRKPAELAELGADEPNADDIADCSFLGDVEMQARGSDEPIVLTTSTITFR